MHSHIKILAILHIISGAVFLIGGLIGATVMGGLAGLVALQETGSDAAVAFPVFGVIGSVILLGAILLSVPSVIAGIGLLSYRGWARILTIILSVLNLFNFPIGTALGVYGLWVLFAPETVALFDGVRVRAYQR